MHNSLKSGICPKCGSDEVFSGHNLDDTVRYGENESNTIPLYRNWINIIKGAPLDNYVCTSCGYVESYISDHEALRKISKIWDYADGRRKQTRTGQVTLKPACCD